MAAKVIGKVIGSSDNAEVNAVQILPDIQNEKKPSVKETQNSNGSHNQGGIFSAEKPNALKKENAPQYQKSYESPNGKQFFDLNNAQKPKSVGFPKKEDKPKNDDDRGENKEIAFFTEPKTVKRKTQRHIFAFQAVTAAAVCLVMLLLKIFVPELYDNLHLYYLRLFRW